VARGSASITFKNCAPLENGKTISESNLGGGGCKGRIALLVSAVQSANSGPSPFRLIYFPTSILFEITKLTVLD
jgi:hypothetical protein